MAGGSEALGTPPHIVLSLGWKGRRSPAPSAGPQLGAILSQGLARLGPRTAWP